MKLSGLPAGFRRLWIPLLRWWGEASCTYGLSEQAAGRVRANQLRAVFKLNALMTTVSLLTAIVIASTFGPEVPVRVAAWLFAMGLFFCGQVAVLRKRRGLPPRSASTRGPRLIERAGLWLAMIWGSVPLLFYGQVDAGHDFLIGAIALGMMCGGAFVLSSLPRAAIKFSALTAAMVFLAIFNGPVNAVVPVGVMLLVFLAIICGSVVTFGLQAARHVVDQMLIADAAEAQKQLRADMHRREAKVIEIVQERSRRAAL